VEEIKEVSFPFGSVKDADGRPDRAYKQQDFANYFSQFISNGVYPNPSNGLKIESLNSNMVLTIHKGSGFINGYGYILSEDMFINISPSNPAYNRKDYIVLQLNHVERWIKTICKEGVASANPLPPVLLRNDDIYELKLAEVLVKSGTQAITQADITDTRLNTAVCGIVHAVVDTVDTTEIFNQYETYLNQKIAEWNETKAQQNTDWETQMSTQQNSWQTQTSTQQNEFNTQQSAFQGWFDGAKNNIATLQSFYFQNWSELNGCKYKEHPKNAEGKYITTINATADDKLIARQTEWQESVNGVNCYMLKQEVFDTDGITVIKEKTKKEYKDAATGIYISEVI